MGAQTYAGHPRFSTVHTENDGVQHAGSAATTAVRKIPVAMAGAGRAQPSEWMRTAHNSPWKGWHRRQGVRPREAPYYVSLGVLVIETNADTHEICHLQKGDSGDDLYFLVLQWLCPNIASSQAIGLSSRGHQQLHLAEKFIH